MFLSPWPSWGGSGALFLCQSHGGKESAVRPARSVHVFFWVACVHMLFFGTQDSV